MTDSKHNAAFYIEVMLLLSFLLFVTIVLVQIFASSRAIGVEAQRKTEATQIAQNIAEMFAAADSDEEFVELLTRIEGSEGVVMSASGHAIGEIGDYTIDVTRSSEDTSAGILELAHIEVQESDTVIFEIDTAKYFSDARVGVEYGRETD
ncbi:MAG: hypothetical protein HGA54_09845 [Actinobacteria bacterium]|nr:hypothetical protein [Actinomycetota bacterium]